MVLALPIVIGVLLGFGIGGSLNGLAALRLRRLELFYGAVALQLLAFPFPFFPWTTSDTVATSIWLASYALLAVGAFSNRRIVGVPLIGVGMASNVVAVVANGRHMPVLPSALRAAHKQYTVQYNSAATAHPHVPWLVDRWAVPRWIHLGNVYSVGDVVIAAGVILLIAAAMRVRAPRGGDAVEAPVPPAPTFPVTGTRREVTVAAEPISPELALVSPDEVAARYRAELPSRPWETFLPATT